MIFAKSNGEGRGLNWCFLAGGQLQFLTFQHEPERYILKYLVSVLSLRESDRVPDGQTVDIAE